MPAAKIVIDLGFSLIILARLLEAIPKEIPIASNYLNDVFDITQIVITGYELGQKSGSRGLQYFTLTASSDTAKIIQQNREDLTE